MSPCQKALNRANKSRLSMLTQQNNQNDGRRSSRSRSAKSQISQLFIKRRKSKIAKNSHKGSNKNAGTVPVIKTDQTQEKVENDKVALRQHSPILHAPSIHIIQHPLLSPNHVQSIALNQHLQSIGLNLNLGQTEVSPSNPYKSYHDLTDKNHQL